MQEIHNRLDEITFNANLLNQLRAIDFVKTLLQKGKLSYENYKDVRMHRIDGTGVLDKYPGLDAHEGRVGLLPEPASDRPRHGKAVAGETFRRDRA